MAHVAVIKNYNAYMSEKENTSFCCYGKKLSSEVQSDWYTSQISYWNLNICS